MLKNIIDLLEKNEELYKNNKILLLEIINDLESLNNKLLLENNFLKKDLKNSKNTYYEENKEIIIKKSNDRLKKLTIENPEKIKEYRKKAYENMKKKREIKKEI
jgi:hypothetical protein